jgi:hypothetical protein
MRSFIFFFVAVATATVSIPPPPTSQQLHHTYLIKFKDEISDVTRQDHLQWMRQVTKQHPQTGIRHVFSLDFNGYSAHINPQVLEQVRHKDEVGSIDHIGLSIPGRDIASHVSNDPSALQRVMYSTMEPSPRMKFMDSPDAIQIEEKGWNANRISHRNFSRGYEEGPWVHDLHLGTGVQVYVLDTGINTQHPGFAGSTVIFGGDFVSSNTRLARDRSQHVPVTTDNQGHGTMCAGVIAGKHGLAPQASTVAVRIADDSNRSACDDVVAGVEWVLSQPGPNNLKVISLSHYGFSGTPDVNSALVAAVNRGVHVVVCAGNDGGNACDVQPSNAPDVITVGSINGYNAIPQFGTTDTDGNQELEGSNVGKCVTVFAPGSKVPTLYAKNEDSEYAYFSWGTSVATPQVAAVVANQLSKVGPVSPKEMKNWIVEEATKDQIEGELKGSPNLIVFNGVG